MTATTTAEPTCADTALRSSRRRRTTRALVVTGGLAAVVAALFVLTMMVGSYGLTAVEVVGSVLGLAADPSVAFVVGGLRLPPARPALAGGGLRRREGPRAAVVLRDRVALCSVW